MADVFRGMVRWGEAPSAEAIGPTVIAEAVNEWAVGVYAPIPGVESRQRSSMPSISGWKRLVFFTVKTPCPEGPGGTPRSRLINGPSGVLRAGITRVNHYIVIDVEVTSRNRNGGRMIVLSTYRKRNVHPAGGGCATVQRASRPRRE
jgi:hypothetical protein